MIGPVNYGDNDQIFVGRDYQTRTPYSEATAKLIDEEIERIIKEAHEKARELLSANRSLLDVMARLLVEKETIYSEEVDMIMEGKSVAEIVEDIDEREKRRKENPFGESRKPVAETTAATSDGEGK